MIGKTDKVTLRFTHHYWQFKKPVPDESWIRRVGERVCTDTLTFHLMIKDNFVSPPVDADWTTRIEKIGTT
ncbi:hypothetical protein Brsp05_04027 [Brucella sp. NBRC 12953]|jgi:hypothetical protein